MKKAPRRLTLSRESLRRLEDTELYGLAGTAATALCPRTLAVRDCVSDQIRTCGCATSPC
ncbi:MAG: hypothetical protein ACJ76Y_30405 [Thermoanaerobaculia bacterium]